MKYIKLTIYVFTILLLYICIGFFSHAHADTTIFTETCQSNPAQQLNNSTTDSGGTWGTEGYLFGDDASAANINSGTTRCGATGATVNDGLRHIMSNSISEGQYYVRSNMYDTGSPGTANNLGVLVNYIDDNTYYACSYTDDMASGLIDLYILKNTSGANSTLATVTNKTNMTSGDILECRIDYTGASPTITITNITDAEQYATVTDSTSPLTKTGKAGVFCGATDARTGDDCISAAAGTAMDEINLITVPDPTITVSGTSNASDGTIVRVAVNSSTAPQTGSVSGGSWSVTAVSQPGASAIVTAFLTDGDGDIADSSESTAIGKYSGSGDFTQMVLNTNVLSVGGTGNQSIAISDLVTANYDSDQDEDIMHDAETGSLLVESAANGYSAEKLDVLASDTFTIGNSESLTTYDLTITGTLTSGTLGTINVARHWVNNGAFTQSTSTVNMNGGISQNINGSTSTTFNNLSLSNASTDVSVNTNATVNGTLTVNASTTLTPGAAIVISGSGTLTGSGTAKVSKASGTDDFVGQYSITNKTLTSLTVDYTGTGAGLSNGSLTYGSAGSGGLKVSGSITGANGTATVGGVFTVTGTFTPSGGTITMNNGSSISNSGSLTFQALTITASATVTGNNSFSTNGNFTVNGSATFTPNAAAVMNGSGTLTGTGTVQVTRTTSTPDFSSQYTISNKTLTSLTIDYASASAQTISAVNYNNLSNSGNGDRTLASSGTIGISGTFSKGSGAYTVTGSTVNYSGAGQTVATIIYNNLTLSGSGTVTMTGVTTVNGDFTASGGTIAAPLTSVGGNVLVNGAAVTTSGNLTVTGSTTVSSGSLTQGTVTYSTASLVCSGTGTLTTAGAAFTVSGTTTVSGGTVHLDNNTGTKLLTGAVAVSSGTLDGASSAIEIRNGITQSSTGAVSITGTATFTTNAQELKGTISIANITVTTINLTNGSTGAGALTVSTTLGGTGNFTNGATGTLNYGAVAAPTVTTFTMDTSGNTMNYNNTSAGQTVRATTYHNLTITKTAQTATLGSGTTTVNNDLTMASGILAGTDNLIVKGEVTGAGTITMTGSSTFTHQIGNAKSFGSSGGSADWTFNNLNFENSSGGDLAVTTRSGGSGKVFVVSGTLTVGNAGNSNKTILSNNSNNRVMDVGSVNITSKGALVASGSAAFTVSGSWTNSGTFTASGGTVTFDDTAGSKTLSGTMVSPSAFAAITFNGVSGGWSVNSTLEATGDFNLTNGTLTQGADVDMTFYGNVTLAEGTSFTKASGSGKFIMDGDAETETFEDQHSTKVNLGAVQIGLSPGTTNMSSDLVADSLTINNGDTLNTKGYNINIATFITINGTLNCTQVNSGHGTNINLGTTWTVASDAIFIAQESETYPTTVTFDEASSGNLSPGGVDDNHDFYNISFSKSSSATVTLQAAIKVKNDLTISNANSALDAAGYAINVGGSWSNSGTFTHNNNTVTFDSADTGETIDSGGNTTGKKFYNVVFNNSGGGWTVQTSNVLVENNLTFTSVSSWANSKTISIRVGGTLTVSAGQNIRMWNSSAVTYTVDSAGSLYSQDHDSVNGDLYIWGNYNVLTNDYWSYATDFDNTSLAGGSERQVDVRIDPAATITVDTGDTLAVLGTASAGRTIVEVVNGLSGGYLFNVQNTATINFQYADFYDLEGAGINITSGTVTSLDYCKFNYHSGGGATDAFITVAASVIYTGGTKTFLGVQFDNDGPGADKNIRRTGDGTGHSEYWLFNNSTGSFDGASDEFENDAQDMIRWIGADTPGGQNGFQGTVMFEGYTIFE